MVQNNIEVVQAQCEDSRVVWEIRYEPSVNAIAMSRQAVSFETHDAWFMNKYFSGGESKCFIVKVSGRGAGYCRFDKNDTGDFHVSIALLPEFQGLGLGQKLLAGSMVAMGRDKFFIADIRKDNQVSLKLFKRNGFALTGEDKDLYYFRK